MEYVIIVFLIISSWTYAGKLREIFNLLIKNMNMGYSWSKILSFTLN